MTSDEVAFAGASTVYSSNLSAPNTYFYRNSISSGCTGTNGDPCSVVGSNKWWTMTPYMYDSCPGYGSNSVQVVDASEGGKLTYASIDTSNAIRPVVTLKPEVKVTGSGTTSDPYIPFINN